MMQPLRIEYDDAYYHVMNRSSCQKWVFRSSCPVAPVELPTDCLEYFSSQMNRFIDQ